MSSKRVFDIVFGLLLLTVFLPVLGIIALLVRLLIGSPVLFLQTRPGLHERPFTLYKFRTMTDARDGAGNLLPDGERLTRLGRFLRSSSLDELPEFINILRGDLSLVGPRPLLPRYLPWYTERERLRHTVRPGITGWAQVNGRNGLPWDERLKLDVWYVENRSLLLDLRILFLTIWKVIRREGVAVDSYTLERDLDEERQEKGNSKPGGR